MATIGIHEYFRIFVPAVLLVVFVKILIPNELPNDATYLMLISAFVGILLTPITDKLCTLWFHRQIIKTRFYETLIQNFTNYYKINWNVKSKNCLLSFSGKLQIPESAETKSILEAYKIFSRQGWGSTEETYRIRTEKSFGILYFTLFCYLSAVLIVYIVNIIFFKYQVRSILKHSYLDIALLIIVIFISLWESKARFQMSLKNELIILESHLKELKSYYDNLIQIEN